MDDFEKKLKEAAKRFIPYERDLEKDNDPDEVVVIPIIYCPKEDEDEDEDETEQR